MSKCLAHQTVKNLEISWYPVDQVDLVSVPCRCSNPLTNVSRIPYTLQNDTPFK